MGAADVNPAEDSFWTDDAAVVCLPKGDARAEVDAPAGGEARGLVWFRTSGSEANPKWVGLSRRALLVSARSVNEFLGATANDVWMRVLPRHHVGGFGVEARAWAAGARLVCDEAKWQPARFLETCVRERVTLTSLVPAQVFDLVEAGLRAPPLLRAAVVGGGELRPLLWRRGRALGWPLLTSYGLTEAGSQVATLRPDEVDPARLTLLPHWAAAVTTDGCLELKGEALATCSLRRDGARGWRREAIGDRLVTADRVSLEAGTHGRWLRFLGRRDRTVKILGELTDLHAVEGAVADAAIEEAVFGRVRLEVAPDERAGHRLVLECLDADEGERVRAAANRRLPRWAPLAEIRVVRDLRLSELGKPVL
jgi:O-succinylbenzoic acid--CoA ligase